MSTVCAGSTFGDEAADVARARPARGRAAPRAACRGRCRSATWPACSCRRARRSTAGRSAGRASASPMSAAAADRPGAEAVVAAEHERHRALVERRAAPSGTASGRPWRCRGCTSSARRAASCVSGIGVGGRPCRRRCSRARRCARRARRCGTPTAPCRRRGGPPPRSSGTPMMWTGLAISSSSDCSSKSRATMQLRLTIVQDVHHSRATPRPARVGAAVGDAVGNADAAEAAAGDEQSRMRARARVRWRRIRSR